MNNDKLIQLFIENGTSEPCQAIFMIKDNHGKPLFWDGQYSFGCRTQDHRSLLNEFFDLDIEYNEIFEKFSILEIRPEYNEIYGDIENDYYIFDYIIQEYFNEYDLVQIGDDN